MRISVLARGALLAVGTLVIGGACFGGNEGTGTSEKPLRYRVEYATYLGGSECEQPREVFALADRSVVIGGQTSSSDLPVSAGAAQTKYAGEPPGTGHGGVYGGDCFIARLNPSASRIEFCTYWGGSKQERATYGFNVDSHGAIVVCTACRSHDAPTTEGSYQPRYGGGASDALLGKLAADGRKFLWCTYVGGRGEDWPRGGTALDAQDNVILVGRSTSVDFPSTEGVLRPRVLGRNGDAMIVKLSGDGKKLIWATLLGGSDWDGLLGARVDKAGNVYVAGHTRSRDLPVSDGAAQPTPGGESDVFLACITPDAKRIRYCTYLAGSKNEFAEHRPALLEDGSFLLTGVTGSEDFPTTEGAYQRRLKGRNDGFLVKLSPDGRKFAFCTLLGGSGGEFFLMPTVGPDGNIYMVGSTTSKDFPVTAGALQPKFGGGQDDAVLAVLSGDGSRLVYATYIGGSGSELIRGLAVTETGQIYLAGNTNSDDLPFISRGAVQPKRKGGHDGLIIKLVPARLRTSGQASAPSACAGTVPSGNLHVRQDAPGALRGQIPAA